jgi:hypothetical protein
MPHLLRENMQIAKSDATLVHMGLGLLHHGWRLRPPRQQCRRHSKLLALKLLQLQQLRQLASMHMGTNLAASLICQLVVS